MYVCMYTSLRKLKKSETLSPSLKSSSKNSSLLKYYAVSTGK